jgi:predicted ATPase/class 3 adenylate cyclase
MPTASAPPTGTVTFLFTDIEGSTGLVQRLGDEWPGLLERHRELLRTAFEARGGHEHGTEGDSFFVVFASAADAVAAAVDGQRALAAEGWPAGGAIRVRMGLHTGDGRLSGGDYVGLDVHRAARIGAAGHGGQVLLSASTASLASSNLPDVVRLVDLGDHRLKDLPRPEHLHQLVIDGLQSEFPPLRSLGARASNLPVALSSLIGREAEVEAVRAALRESRLVTVTGPGGTGKTRLVQAVARDVAGAFGGGATFVPLESIRDADLIAVEILRALRLDAASTVPPIDRVIDAVGDRDTLLVLDSLEQIVGASAVIRSLSAAAPRLTILSSSQAALRVAGEHEHPLGPLPDADAVRLFVERARAVVPTFALDDSNRSAVVAICERVDRLPLAIELAAAQVRILSPTTILARISDRIDAITSRQEDLPERQRTLRAAVAWSYDLLGADDQALFRRLSVFVGGATITEIEAFEARRFRDSQALETLESLVDRSLVVVRRTAADEHRFVVLETIRAVARELLAAAGEETQALRDHASVFEQLAIQAEPGLYGRSRRAWLDRLAAEHANLRAAIDDHVASGNVTGALEIASRMWRFWQSRGHLLEARTRLRDLLERASAQGDVPAVVLSRAEEAAGSIAYWSRGAGADDIEPHYRRSLELARAAGDRDREAWAMYNLAFVYDFMAMGGSGGVDFERSDRLRADALEIFRAVGDRRGIGESLWALAARTSAIRKPAAVARAQLHEASALLEEIGDTYGSGWVNTSIGMLELDEGRLTDARDALLRAAAIFLADEDLAGELIVLRNLAALAGASGDERTAVRIDAAVVAAARRIGIDPPVIEPLVRQLTAARARLAPDVIADEERAGELLDARRLLEAATAAARRVDAASDDAHARVPEREDPPAN